MARRILEAQLEITGLMRRKDANEYSSSHISAFLQTGFSV
jgi:hypothetical protein